MIFLAAFSNNMSSIEDQKGLYDKYTKRLQVVRDIKERQNVEFQGMWLCHSWTVLFNICQQISVFIANPFLESMIGIYIWSSKVFIKTESTLASLLFNRLVTKHGTVKYVIANYNPSDIFAYARLVWTHHVTEYAPARTGKYPSDIPQFSKLRMVRKIF